MDRYEKVLKKATDKKDKLNAQITEQRMVIRDTKDAMASEMEDVVNEAKTLTNEILEEARAEVEQVTTDAENRVAELNEIRDRY